MTRTNLFQNKLAKASCKEMVKRKLPLYDRVFIRGHEGYSWDQGLFINRGMPYWSAEIILMVKPGRKGIEFAGALQKTKDFICKKGRLFQLG